MSYLPRRALLKSLSAVAAAGAVASLAACAPPQRTTPASLRFISRSEWGAAEPDLDAPAEHGLFHPETNPEGWRVYETPLSQVLTTLVVHHSALPLSDGPLDIQRLHMQNKGFADVGYHFLIDERGSLYEGRSLTVRGAHTGGHNTGTVGVALLGNFERNDPPDAQRASLRALGEYLAVEYGLTHLAGHRDFQPGETACPGRRLEPLLPDMAAELGLQFGTSGYDGPPS